MTGQEHERLRGLLPAAAAGALDAGEQRLLEQHAAECAECGREWAALCGITEALAELPAPRIPPGLAGRAKMRVRAREGAAREDRLSGAIVLFLVLFGWTITLLPWLVSLVSGAPVVVLGVTISNPLVLLGGSTLLAWLTGGVTVVVLLWRPRREWRIS